MAQVCSVCVAYVSVDNIYQSVSLVLSKLRIRYKNDHKSRLAANTGLTLTEGSPVSSFFKMVPGVVDGTCDSVRTPLSLQQARATLLQTPPKRGASRQLDDGTDDLSGADMSDDGT